MPRLLYIQASPRGDRSHSLKIGRAFLDTYRKANPGDEIVPLDLFQEDLVPFDGAALRAKYRILRGEDATDEEREAWKRVERRIEQFTAADKYVVASPMWNFSIPYRLKQYIDILVQPGYTFRVTDEGEYEGLVVGKPMFIAAARGGEYRQGTEAEDYDMQRPYLEAIFRFIGFEDIRWAVDQPTVFEDQEYRDRTEAEALRLAREAAVDF